MGRQIIVGEKKTRKNVQKIYRPLKIGWRSRVPENTQPPASAHTHGILISSLHGGVGELEMIDVKIK